MSRIYGGIHWQYDNVDALVAGRALGECIFDNRLRRIGDLNGDNVVNVLDLMILLGAKGWNPGHPADLNGDGFVVAQDLVILVKQMSLPIEPAF